MSDHATSRNASSDASSRIDTATTGRSQAARSRAIASGDASSARVSAIAAGRSIPAIATSARTTSSAAGSPSARAQ